MSEVPERSSGGLSNDQIVLVLLGAGAVVVLAAKRHLLLAWLRGWLQARSVTLAGQEGLVSTPFGGLDLARLLVVGGLVVLAAVAGRFLVRRSRSTAR